MGQRRRRGPPAGALHGAALARELSIPVVIVPPNPGITSALGCLLVDLQHDLSESYIMGAAEADPAVLQARFLALEAPAGSHCREEELAPYGELLDDPNVKKAYLGV